MMRRSSRLQIWGYIVFLVGGSNSAHSPQVRPLHGKQARAVCLVSGTEIQVTVSVRGRSMEVWGLSWRRQT